MEKLRFIFCNYGLGKYYIYSKGNKKFPFIQMNIHMFHYDKQLFYWVLSHELDHYVYFNDLDNQKKTDWKNELQQMWPTKYNAKLLVKQFKFELNQHGRAWNKGFAVNQDKTLLDSPDFINYFGNIKRLSEEEEKKIMGFVGKVEDL